MSWDVFRVDLKQTAMRFIETLSVVFYIKSHARARAHTLFMIFRNFQYSIQSCTYMYRPMWIKQCLFNVRTMRGASSSTGSSSIASSSNSGSNSSNKAQFVHVFTFPSKLTAQHSKLCPSANKCCSLTAWELLALHVNYSKWNIELIFLN